jgi:Tfp pilus assembly protein PilV
MCGASIVEALVALALAALAVGGLAATAATSVRGLVRARHDATALTVAAERLEALRAGPRGSDGDARLADGTVFARTWRTTPGRGRPDQLDVTVAWEDHRLELGSEVWP